MSGVSTPLSKEEWQKVLEEYKKNKPLMPVYLNIYDLAPTPNNLVHCCGLGAYHSGIECYGTEISFGRWGKYGDDENDTGIFECVPKNAPDGPFRESIFLGETKLSYTEFYEVVKEFEENFRAAHYDLVTKNCNHFTEEFAVQLITAEPKNSNSNNNNSNNNNSNKDLLSKEERLKYTTLIDTLIGNRYGTPTWTNRLSFVLRPLRCCIPRMFLDGDVEAIQKSVFAPLLRNEALSPSKEPSFSSSTNTKDLGGMKYLAVSTTTDFFSVESDQEQGDANNDQDDSTSDEESDFDESNQVKILSSTTTVSLKQKKENKSVSSVQDRSNHEGLANILPTQNNSTQAPTLITRTFGTTTKTTTFDPMDTLSTPKMNASYISSEVGTENLTNEETTKDSTPSIKFSEVKITSHFKGEPIRTEIDTQQVTQNVISMNTFTSTTDEATTLANDDNFTQETNLTDFDNTITNLSETEIGPDGEPSDDEDDHADTLILSPDTLQANLMAIAKSAETNPNNAVVHRRSSSINNAVEDNKSNE